jgi:signal transduction histidine kinase
VTRTARRIASILATVTAAGLDLLFWAGDSELRWGGNAPVWLVPLLTVVTVGALLVRRRAPVAVFWTLWVLGLAGLVIPRYTPFACLLVALHGLTARRTARVSGPALAAMAAPFGIDSLNAVGEAAPDKPLVALLATVAGWAVLAAAAFSLGRVSFAANRRAELLEELRVRDTAQALQAERLRLARELHDVVSHAVTAMLLQAAGARTLTDRDGPVGSALSAIESSGRRAMAELHEMLNLLRQVPELEAGAAASDGLAGVARVRDLTEEAARMGLNVRHCESGEPGTLHPETDLTAYRLVQEALTNAAKHAGPDADVLIDLQWSPRSLTIAVTSTPDPTRPPEPRLPSSGRGLLGLTERVALAGGSLRTRTVGPSFELCAELPTQTAPTPEPAAEAAHLA